MSEKTESISTDIKMDTTSYKAGVSEINRQIRVLESGFRASAASMDDWSKSATGLESRNKTLSQSMELQKQKISALTAEYTKLASDGKTSAKELEELQIKINKETEALGKNEKELRNNEKALVEMGGASGKTGEKVDDLAKKQQDATKKAEDFKKGMQNLATGLQTTMKAVAGLAAAVAGVGLAVGKMVFDTAASADALSELSAKTGISTTRLQELSYVGKQVGTDAETITGSLAKLTRNMNGARDGTGDAAAAFKSLGVPITDANGALRDSETVFGEAITALSGIKNETERDAVAMTIFGKSAMELNPLIKAGAEEMARLSEEAHKVGAVMSEEDVKSMGDFNDTLDSLKDGLKGTMGTLATAFLPAFQNLAGLAGGYLKDFSAVVRGAGGDLGKMAGGIGQLVGKIANDIATQGPQMLQAGLSILQGIVNSIVTNLPVLLPAVIQMITSLVNFLVQNLPMIITAALQIVIALANGLTQALPTLIPAIVAIIPQIITTLLENLPLLILAAVQLILALTQGLIAALPVLIPEIPKIVQAIFDALIVSLPLIGVAALQLIVVLVKGIVDNLPMVWDSAVQLCQNIQDGIWATMSSINDMGRNIVNGVWNGIQSKYSEFRSKVLSFFSGIVDSVKGALGIHSPSTVFAGIGENMAAGLGIGFANQFEQIKRNMNGAMVGLAGASASTGSAGNSTGSGYGIRNNSLQMGGIHITVSGNGDPQIIGKSSEQGVLKALRAAGLA